LSDGFTEFSVAGPQLWACTTFGHNANDPDGLLNAPSAVQMNGFANNVNTLNEDWLISPQLNLTAFDFPLLSFFSRTAFNGAPLELKISTNYIGGNPNLATWTTLNGKFPATGSNKWTLSSNTDLTNFKQNNVHIAWVYHSTNADGSRWTLDDIKIDNSLVQPPAPLPTISVNPGGINFGFVANGNTSTKSFVVTGNDLTEDIVLNSASNFTISTDPNIDFSNNLILDDALVNNIPQTIFVKFAPSQADVNYNSIVTATSSGINKQVSVSGNSIGFEKSLEVVNWNLEWFGSPDENPVNDDVQQANVETITENIAADIFAFEEVVNETRLQNVVNHLNAIYGPGTYSSIVSNYGSHTNPFDPDIIFALNTSQKLAFVYKTAMFSNITTEALLSSGINTPADVIDPDYHSWASGRYPFMMKADVNVNGIIKTIRFVVIHAKANTGNVIDSYNRRKAGADALHTYFNTNFPNDNIILLGDFNDDLDETITVGIDPKITSYSSFTNDGANFFSPTLSLSLQGQKSTTGFNDVIDHQMLSNEMQELYLPNSVAILTDVENLVTNYSSTTTDHYPVFSRYAFDPLIILPVTLLTFNAAKHDKAVQLDWATTQEINSKHFVVERSADGLSWTVVETVNAAGNSNTQKNYSYTDNKPLNSANFYRLKLVDADEKFKYSAVRKVIFETNYKVSISPNPAVTYFNVKIDNMDNAANVTIKVINANGAVVYRTTTTQPSFKVNTSSFAKGLYTIQVENSGKVMTERIVVQ
jgi:hypothetical protein